MIESYSFGRMSINGVLYTADLIIYPDGEIQGSWWRREGHRLRAEDILALIEAKPEIIVAGTGASGLMKPERGLAEQLAAVGIELIAQPSKKAMDTFNHLLKRNHVIGGCFHLTC